MATREQVEQMLKNEVALLGAIEYLGNTSNDNILSLATKAREDATGDYADRVVAAARRIRQTYAAQLTGAFARRLTPVLETELERLGSSDTVPFSLNPRGRIHEDFREESRTVLSRDITRGAVNDSGVPDAATKGTLHRLTVDEFGTDMQGDADVVGYQFKCVQSAAQGVPPGNEVFRVEALQRRGRDVLTNRTRFTRIIEAFDVRNTFNSALANPSFDGVTIGASDVVENIGTWTKGDGTAVTDSDGLLAFAGQATATGRPNRHYLRFTQNLTLKQRTRRTPTPAALVGVWVRKNGSPEGSIKLRMGTREATLAHGSITSDWQLLLLDQQDWWPNRWLATATGEVEFEIEADYSSQTGTEGFEIDDALLLQVTPVNGLGAVMTAGAASFVLGDTFKYEDTEVVDPFSIQRAFAIGYGGYLPHTDTTPSIDNPSIDPTTT